MEKINEYPKTKEKNIYIFIDISRTKGFAFKKSCKEEEMIGFIIKYEKQIDRKMLIKIKKQLKRIIDESTRRISQE